MWPAGHGGPAAGLGARPRPPPPPAGGGGGHLRSLPRLGLVAARGFLGQHPHQGDGRRGGAGETEGAIARP
eukprot:1191234-Prorocentrum_minimum.AAC.1